MLLNNINLRARQIRKIAVNSLQSRIEVIIIIKIFTVWHEPMVCADYVPTRNSFNFFSNFFFLDPQRGDLLLASFYFVRSFASIFVKPLFFKSSFTTCTIFIAGFSRQFLCLFSFIIHFKGRLCWPLVL